MSTALTTTQPQMGVAIAYAAPPAIDWEEVERIVNDIVLRNQPAEQRLVLMAWCRRFQLDPLAQEVVLISGRPFVTLAGLSRVAERSGMLAGFETDAEETERGYIAVAHVYRKDWTHPGIMKARQWEHINPKSPAWQKAPAAMTEKCALSRDFRVSFHLVGLTAAEEVGYDEETEETNAGRVTVIRADAKPLPAYTSYPAVGAGQAAGSAQGNGRAPIETTATEASAADDADFGWTEFWSWARSQGFTDRKALDEKVGQPTQGMTPLEIRKAIEAKQAQPAKKKPTVEAALAFIADAGKPLERRVANAKWVIDQAGDLATLQRHGAALEQSLEPAHYAAHFRECWVALGGATQVDEPGEDVADGEFAEVADAPPFDGEPA